MLSAPQFEIYKSNQQINLFLAGVGSGKTYLDGIISYRLIQQNPTIRGFIGANTYDQLNTSTFFRIREVWESFGITEWSEKEQSGHYVVNKQPPVSWKIRTNFTSYNNIVTFINGCNVFLGSLDNAKAHEGKEFGWAILDETKDSKEEDVKDVILARLRQRGLKNKQGEDWNPLFISTAPAKTDWINQWFKLDEHIEEITNCIFNKYDYYRLIFDNKMVIISSTYHNEDNLPENYIENKKSDWSNEKFKTLIYANPFSQTGGEWIPSFDRLKNVKKCEYNPDAPLHISFDFNSVPYSPAALFHIYKVDEIYEVYCFAEIALKNPNNSTESVCERIIANYGKHKAGTFVYADATGQWSNSLTKEYKHHIDMIEKKLKPMLNNNSNRIPYTNLANIKRRDVMNAIFEDKKPIRIYVDPECRLMIDDLIYTKQDSVTGLKDKKTIKDSETGETYQKYGHFVDLLEYFITSAFEMYMK